VKSIFLSYSSQDYFFAEMLAIKLGAENFTIWRDQGSIRAGDDWRQSIEEGIRDCLAVVVALSISSAESPYVTYEWAYAIGMGKPVIPVKLSECRVHPRLEPNHYIDFSYPKALPWNQLVERLKEIEVEKDSSADEAGSARLAVQPRSELEDLENAVLNYLNSRGFSMASFERLRKATNTNATDETFRELIDSRPAVFRRAVLKGGQPGIAKRAP